MRVRIAGIASVLPPCIASSRSVEAAIMASSPGLKVPGNIVQNVTGIQNRRYAEPEVNTSDLAAEAARRVLAKTGTPLDEVDLLIFASAGQDLIEPATAHITQAKLGTQAAVMDVKNACNSFINGLQVAEALILAGQYQKALVVVGETPSKCIKWNVADRKELRLSFPGYTFGDAGAAALLEADAGKNGESGVFYRKFQALSQYWSVGTLPCGGSMHPRGDEYTYFSGDGAALKEAFLGLGPAFLHQALQVTGTSFADYARILVHQVTVPFLEMFMEVTGVPAEKVVVTLPEYGNMAAASLPVGFDLAESRGEIERGDRVMLIGLAGGISLGIISFIY